MLDRTNRIVRAMMTLSVAVYCNFVSSASAQTSYPMLMSLHPTAAQVGVTSTHTVKSRYSMLGAYDVLVTGNGVRGEIVPAKVKKGAKPSTTSIQIKFHVAKDALPGVRDFRIATPRGVSTLGQLVVTTERVAVEKGPNDQAEKAQAIEVPSTVCGAIEKSEDVDYYKFSAKKGQSLSFHVQSMRLQDRIHDLQTHVDPILTLKTAQGVTLKASDNAFYADPYISQTFERDGDYLLEIRDVRYKGNSYWEYAIEISGRPFIQTVFPLGLAVGSDTSVEPVGNLFPKGIAAIVKLPGDMEAGSRAVELTIGKLKSNPVSLFATRLNLVMESGKDNNSIENATPISVPSGVNGRIETEKDIDYFSFQGKKGQRISIEVIARRLQSSLDSHIRILNEAGKQQQLSDDLSLGKRTYSDSWIQNWTVPKAGKYFVEVRDLHLRGGPAYTYFLQIQESEPTFELYADTDKTQLTPGTCGVVFVRVERKNGFTGEVQLGVENLPAGVTATCGKILANGKDGCIVLEAAKGAKMVAGNIAITGKAIGSNPMPPQTACSYQETYQPGGGRGHWPVSMHTVSIGKSNDITRVELSTYHLTLKPGTMETIDVTIDRKAGFKSNVTLDVIYKHLSSVYGNSLPAGVSIDGNASKTLLTSGATKGKLVFKADAKAKPVQKQQISVMANVSLNFVMKATYSSKPLLITVTK